MPPSVQAAARKSCGKPRATWLAGLAEFGQRRGGQCHVEAAEVIGELLGGPGAEDGDDAALGTQPGQGYDRGAEPQAGGHPGDGLGGGHAAQVRPVQAPLAGGRGRAGVLAGQQASGRKITAMALGP